MNSLLLTLTALFILVLSALFAAPLFIDWNDYRPQFEAQASKLLGRQVKVDGKVHLIVLPAPQLKFDHIKVANEDGDLKTPFLEAKSLEAKLDVGTLLTGKVEAHELTVIDPTLRLKLNKDGSGNWGDIGQGQAGVPFVPKDVLLDSVHVSGGTVEIVKDGVPTFVFRNVDGEASGASLAGPYKVTATYDFEDRQQTLRFSTGVMDEDGRFRMKAALRDPDRSATYQLDGFVSGLRGTPSYGGKMLMRITTQEAQSPNASAQSAAALKEAEQIASGGEVVAPRGLRETASFVELKGPLKVSAEGAELSAFDLTLHASGRPQILKGNLNLDFRPPFRAEGKLAARWVDLDALFGAAPSDERPAPAAVIVMFADWVLDEAKKIGEGSLALDIEQAGLGGDLAGALDVRLTSDGGGVTIEQLKATLPGENRISASGRLRRGQSGPLFTGPIKIDGAGLRALTRWAAGDRAMMGQPFVGDFSLQADATVGDGEIKLANAVGAVSGTQFGGSFLYEAGATNQIDIDLTSDRLDLREVLGDEPLGSAWLSTSESETPKSQEASQEMAPAANSNGLLKQLRDDDVRASVQVGELLLPDLAPGKLDAKLSLSGGTLDVEYLDFVAPGAITLGGKGRIASLADSPSGQVDLTLQAQENGSLRALTRIFGFSDNVVKSKHLSALAPLDLRAALVAAREGETTKVSLELNGHVGGSDVALVAKANGAPKAPMDAQIDIAGSVTGNRPQALLVLLFPDLPQYRLAKAAGDQGTLSVKVTGIPSQQLSGRGALETSALQLAFDGTGAVKEDGTALSGFASISTEDASLALPLLGLDPPPSASGVPLSVSASVTKQAGKIDLEQVKAKVDDRPIEGRAHFDRGGALTTFDITAAGERISLPALMGVLVAWERTASTEEVLGAVGEKAAQVWPARGFALGILDNAQGNISLSAKTLSLGQPFQVRDGKLSAKVDSNGLAIESIQGQLFGGTFSASGTLSPRGSGAALTAKVDLKAGDLTTLSKAVTGQSLAKGPFDLTFNVQGEGLSPPGVVAGLEGEGVLGLGSGVLTTFTAEPLRQIAAKAARSNVQATKEQIDADAQGIRNSLTKGTYQYAPASFAFDVKNGTLRFAPAALASKGVETSVKAYVELASLRLDSEWQMRLTSPQDAGVPPMGIVYAGPLDNAGTITPAVGTAAIESQLTIDRLQDDVERLETLDVTGRTPPTDTDAKVRAEAEARAKAEAQEKAEAQARAEAQAQAQAEREAEARRAAEKAAAEKAARESAEAQAVADRAAAERAAAEARAEAERAEAQRAAAEQAARERADAQARAVTERAAAEKAAADAQAAKDRASADAEAAAQAKARARAAADRSAAEKAAAEKAAQERAAMEAKAAEQREATARAAAEQEVAEKAAADAKAAAQRAAQDRAVAEARAASEAKAAAQARAAADRASKERAAAEARAAADRAARARIEAEARAAAQRAAAAPGVVLPLPSAGSPLQPSAPQIDANAAPGDPIADVLEGDAAAGVLDEAATEGEEVVEPTTKRKRRRARRKSRRDDWKKNYSIFGGGFGGR